MDEETFYQQCAIAAMQGLQEGSKVVGIGSDIMCGTLAAWSFNIADKMLEEYRKRRPNIGQ